MNARSATVLLVATWAFAVAACSDDANVSASAARARVVVAVEPGPSATAAKVEIVFGQPFVLRVERTWQRGMRASTFDARALLPLVVEQTESSTQQRGDLVVETRRFRAQAFVRDSVTIGPLRLVAAPEGGGAPVEAASEPLVVAVRSSLSGDGDLAVEQPMELARPEAPRGWGWILALVVAAAFAAVSRALRMRARVATPAPVPVVTAEPPRDLRAEALAAFAALESRPTSDEEFAQLLAFAVRGHARAMLRLRADTLTTEEIEASLRLHAKADAAARATAALLPCDLVKFARMRIGAEQRARAIADARAFVEAAS